MAAMEAANFHHSQQRQQAYPPLPASPTLTNPDMILPDYERSDSPDEDLISRDHPSLMMWKAGYAVTGGDSQMFAAMTPGQQLMEHPYGPTAPITPTTPIIYGNGTMLSDIGEVTEVESTIGRPSPSRHRGVFRQQESPTKPNPNDAGRAASPSLGVKPLLQKRSKQSIKRERRSSNDSTSTITTQDQAALFADFDDSVSVVDSVFQADDEESLASSYVEGNAVPEPARLAVATTDTDRLSTYSTTSLSRRAEEILANAKKRLTTMEGNLSRARTSLHGRSPSSVDSDDTSTPSPPVQRARTAMYTRDNDVSSSTPSPGHSRQSSDTAGRRGLSIKISERSQSALGVAGGYRQPLTASKSIEMIRQSLETLSEDEAADPPLSAVSNESAKLDQFLSPTFGSYSSDNGNGRLQRSASVTQMRDLKDQVKGLKGKISSLREQARADTMKRRSLQTMRTPSPFTHAQVNQWYAEPQSKRNSQLGAEAAGDSNTGRNPWNGEESSVDGGDNAMDAQGLTEDDESIYSEVEISTQLRPATSHSPDRGPTTLDAGLTALGLRTERDPDADNGSDGSDLHTENGDFVEGLERPEEELPVGFHEAQDLGYESESGESLYHDTVQHPISHEDREDAFDYEHFFLHSAMGTMSQQRLARRQSGASVSSEGSVETTRGPITNDDAKGSGNDSSLSKVRRRRNSDSSVSTVETFATADEGRWSKAGSSSARQSLDNYREQILDAPEKPRSETPETAKRTSFGAGTLKMNANGPFSVSSSKVKDANRHSDGSISPIPEEGKEDPQSTHRQRPSRRPMSSSAIVTSSMRHRPSVSSFDSTGTNRSFPLVNKHAKSNSTGVLTPNSSPDQELKSLSNTLLNETASIYEQQLAQQQEDDGRGHLKADSLSSIRSLRFTANPNSPQALQTLLREDQYLVERIVASLGRCVLGLTESGRASTESRMYRRRLDAARRILEGLETDGTETF